MSDEAINSRIDRIEVTLSHAVDAIEKLASVVNRPKETRWGPVVAALGLTLAAMTGYTTLVTAPLERDAVHLREEVSGILIRELQREREIGRIEGREENGKARGKEEG